MNPKPPYTKLSPESRAGRICVAIDAGRYRALKKLAQETQTPITIYVRKGIDLILEKHAEVES